MPSLLSIVPHDTIFQEGWLPLRPMRASSRLLPPHPQPMDSQQFPAALHRQISTRHRCLTRCSHQKTLAVGPSLLYACAFLAVFLAAAAPSTHAPIPTFVATRPSSDGQVGFTTQAVLSRTPPPDKRQLAMILVVGPGLLYICACSAGFPITVVSADLPMCCDPFLSLSGPCTHLGPASNTSAAWVASMVHANVMLFAFHTHNRSCGDFFYEALLPASTHAALRKIETWPRDGTLHGVQKIFSKLTPCEAANRHIRAPTMLTPLGSHIGNAVHAVRSSGCWEILRPHL